MVKWKKHCVDNDLLTNKEAETLCSNVEILRNMSETLLGDMRNVYEHWDYKEGVIGQTMVDFALYFQLYKDYCNNTDHSQKL